MSSSEPPRAERPSKRRGTRPTMKNRLSARELRNTLLGQRQQETVQLRKQRREERLQARRLGANYKQKKHASGVASSQLETLKSVTTHVQALDAFLQSPSTLECLRSFREAVIQADATEFLEQIEAEQPDKALLLILKLSEKLVKNSQDSGSMGADEESTLVCDILLAITSSFSSSRKNQQASDDYYGQSKRHWSDLMLEDPSLLSTLLESLRVPSVSNILGNLVQDRGGSSHHLQKFWMSYRDIVDHLPQTSYLCAAMAQKDPSSYGSDFLNPLSPPQLAGLFQGPTATETTMVDGAWFLEGVSRRENMAVQQLCRDESLMHVLATTLTEQATARNSAVVFPALKVIGNLAVACEGYFIPPLMHYFGEQLSRILEQGTVVEVLRTVACFLCDAGWPGHVSTDVALPRFVPFLINAMFNGTHEWKREAVTALEFAVTEPPYSAVPPPSAMIGNVNLEVPHDCALIIWNTILPSEDHEKCVFLSALLDLSGSPDMVMAMPAIRVLDRFLRGIPNTPAMLSAADVPSVVDRLNAILAVGSNKPNAVVNDRAEVALDLLDDFFETDEDDDFDYANMFPALQFPTNQPSFETAAAAAPSPAMGRGRGRAVPAWMAN